ncbi:MAG: SdpI family protein [Candidatus Nealsonbacteria bacterium]|nr:SdpI family protein [Candidatus Nealsonbacteria bacterium]
MTKKNTQLLLEALPIALILITFIVGLMLYPRLPESMPSHWGVSGEIDSLMSKNLAVILYPLLTLIVYLLMTFTPIFDPLRENYSKFTVPYFWFRTATVLFLCLLYFYSLWVALGGELNIVYFIVPVLALYFVLLGFFLPKVKRNYFVGIRTPWTLHSEKVWDMTHVFGEKVFVGTGVLSLFSVLMPYYSFFIFISLIILAFCAVTVYSYYAFKEVEKMPKSKRR